LRADSINTHGTMSPLKNTLLGSSLLLCMTGLVHAAAPPAQQATTDTGAQATDPNQAAGAQQATPTQTTTIATGQPTTIATGQPATIATGQPTTIATGQPAPVTGAATAPQATMPPPATQPVVGAMPTVTPMPGAAPGTVVPATAPGTVLEVPATAASPAMVVPVTPGAAAAPAAYVPKTAFDNTPHRFNMTQDGKKMSANDFDAWMRSKGYRVAKGLPPAACPNAPPAGVETVVGPDGCPVQISIELGGVTFEFAKATLRPEAKKTLDQAVEILKRHPELTVEVAGHTDARGADDFNQKLSLSRAKTVYDYMVEKGIDKKQLEGPVGYGESKPLASNDTDAGRDQNRRTELNVKAVTAPPAPTQVANAPVAAGTAPAVDPTTPAAAPAAPPATVPATAPAMPAPDATVPAPAMQPATVPANSPPGTLPTQPAPTPATPPETP
jgi:outer membrane protein OmpA-like peptidoglycan-associated protein